MIKTINHVFTVHKKELNYDYLKLTGTITTHDYKEKTDEDIIKEIKKNQDVGAFMEVPSLEAEIVLVKKAGYNNKLIGFFVPNQNKGETNPFIYLIYKIGIAESYSSWRSNDLKVPDLTIELDKRINVIKWEAPAIELVSGEKKPVLAETDLYNVFMITL